MRALITLFFLLASFPAFAQSPDPLAVQRQAMMVESQLAQLERDIGLLAEGLRRDAFIVIKITAAAGELGDFQRHVALQKALDLVSEATQRAGQKPHASRDTMLLLSRLVDLLEKAQDQGLSADVSTLRLELLKGAGRLQRQIFLDLRRFRSIRQICGDLQKRAGDTIVDFDQALEEALASAFGILADESGK